MSPVVHNEIVGIKHGLHSEIQSGQRLKKGGYTTAFASYPTRFPDDMSNKRASKVGPTED